MIQYNYNDSINILRDIHWVGFYDEQADLHCNPYLMVDGLDVILFDPGSIPHFSIVMRKIIDLIHPESINHIVASHQDPDICGNLPVMEDLINNPELRIITESGCVRLIQHYGINSKYFKVDKNNNKLILKSGRVLEFIPTPYLHSPFAIMTYDIKTKTLFSSDIFGTVSKDWELFKEINSTFKAMKLWHQAIMPSNVILKKCMEKLQDMDIERILPQHGSIIEGSAEVKTAITFLKDLPCGIDLD
ncbi:MAG: MBL fold metallo-hydrolase [Nitrospirae bacterium]|nr:MBL fold metallo-hydrolase [Nitrospirota bacterium]